MTQRLQAPVFGSEVEARLLAEFHRAAAHVPAYRTLLDEQRVAVGHIHDLHTFSALCPLLARSNTFDRFPLTEMMVGGELRDVVGVLTSSGQGGRFSFGVISKKEASASASFVDAALDQAFAVKSRATLAINCLPMGVGLPSHSMAVAATSVREDMAVAVVQALGDRYEQIILVSDPLFMKRLTDHADEQMVDWRRYRVNAVLGEEVFGENFRGYVARCLRLDLDHPERGYILSSFGVAELGLNLGVETLATIGLRRLAAAKAGFARDLLGRDTTRGESLPILFTFDPQRTFIEVVEPDNHGYGKLTVSMLDPDRLVPLLRYQTGDVARLLDCEHVAATLRQHDVHSCDVPAALLAFQGRDKERLPNGSHVGLYKDALYANAQFARSLTGAVRLIFSGSRCTMHVQLVRGQGPDKAVEHGILRAIAANVRPADLVLWRYADFPFGMGLDYERKFLHYVAGEQQDDPRDASNRRGGDRDPLIGTV